MLNEIWVKVDVVKYIGLIFTELMVTCLVTLDSHFSTIRAHYHFYSMNVVLYIYELGSLRSSYLYDYYSLAQQFTAVLFFHRPHKNSFRNVLPY